MFIVSVSPNHDGKRKLYFSDHKVMVGDVVRVEYNNSLKLLPVVDVNEVDTLPSNVKKSIISLYRYQKYAHPYYPKLYEFIPYLEDINTLTLELLEEFKELLYDYNLFAQDYSRILDEYCLSNSKYSKWDLNKIRDNVHDLSLRAVKGILTGIITQDKFSEGLLDTEIKKGLVLDLVLRIKELDELDEISDLDYRG